MHLTLVMPAVGRKPGEPYPRSWTMEPLAFGVLAALTPPHIQVALIDDRLESIPYDAPTDAVGINVEAYTARRAYAIAAKFRARGIPVILGGYHPTLMPDEAAQFADAIVVGPAETVWPQILADLQAHALRPRYHGHATAGQAGVLPRRDLFAGRKYLPITLVETGRGCCFGCEFCSVAGFYRQIAVPRPIPDVVADIANARRKSVFFVDDNIVVDPARARSLFAALKPMGIRWFSQGSITMAGDPELLKAMRESGCCGVLIGFESLSPATLATMGKGWSCAQRDHETSIARIREAGIPIYATFVFGYDTDDADVFPRTVDFAIRQKFFLAAFNHLVPFPGTALYERLRRENRLLNDPWWLSPDYRFGDVAFAPKTMSAESLARRCYDARSAFFSASSVLARAWDFRTNLRDLRSAMLYFWINAMSRNEAHNRKGLPLGSGLDEATCPPLNCAAGGICA